jgi:hypothetical protein
MPYLLLECYWEFSDYVSTALYLKRKNRRILNKYLQIDQTQTSVIRATSPRKSLINELFLFFHFTTLDLRFLQYSLLIFFDNLDDNFENKQDNIDISYFSQVYIFGKLFVRSFLEYQVTIHLCTEWTINNLTLYICKEVLNELLNLLVSFKLIGLFFCNLFR